MDWNLRACARHGHLTYAPDEEPLRRFLHTTTAVGPAWRCLRCGAFVPGPPRSSGPAEQAPPVLRGRALRDVFILRLLAVERGIRGLLLVLVAGAVWRFSDAEASLRGLFERELPLLRPLAGTFGYDLNHSPVVGTIRHVFAIGHSTLLWVSLAIFAYAVMELVEGIGLWFARRWAEYFTVVATAVFLPLEVYELSERITAVRVGAFIVNVAAVVYLIVAKRLFGVRGGAAAMEAERRGESLLEVEHAASDPAHA